jgi:anti-repressor protein
MQLTYHTFQAGDEVVNLRSINYHSVVLMSAVDACAALGYAKPAQAWAKLKDRNPELHKYLVTPKLGTTDGKAYATDAMPLEGIVHLCMLAKTTLAEVFRNWATQVLTKEILKPKLPTHLETARDLVAALESVAELEAALAKAAPAAAIVERFTAAEGWLTVAEVSKALGDPKLGPNKLYTWLVAEELAYIRYEGKRRIYLPAQNCVNKGWMKTVPRTYEKNISADQIVMEGLPKHATETVAYTQLVISPKGYRAIAHRLGAEVAE